jgi:hypothetical protein
MKATPTNRPRGLTTPGGVKYQQLFSTDDSDRISGVAWDKLAVKRGASEADLRAIGPRGRIDRPGELGDRVPR